MGLPPQQWSAVLIVFVLTPEGDIATIGGEPLTAGEVTALSVNHEIEEHGGRPAGEDSIRHVLRTMHQVSFPRQSIVVLEGDRLRTTFDICERVPVPEGGALLRITAQCYAARGLPETETAVLDWTFWAWSA